MITTISQKDLSVLITHSFLHSITLFIQFADIIFKFFLALTLNYKQQSIKRQSSNSISVYEEEDRWCI